ALLRVTALNPARVPVRPSRQGPGADGALLSKPGAHAAGPAIATATRQPSLPFAWAWRETRWAETLGLPPSRVLAGLAQARLRRPRQEASSLVPGNSAGSAWPSPRPSIGRPPTKPPDGLLVPLRDDPPNTSAGFGLSTVYPGLMGMLARLRP